MNSRLSEIFNSAIEEEEELEMISNQNIVVEDTEEVVNPPDNQNSGPPLSEGNSTYSQEMQPLTPTSWHRKHIDM